MNVLLINGSPRKKGNTAAAIAAVKSGLPAEYRAEVLDVIDLNMKGCINCDACKHNGGNCVLPDDGAWFIRKVAAADLIVFGSPVYWWGISGQLKMALDKFYSRDEEFHRTPKKIGIIAIGAADTGDPEYHLISGQFKCIADYLGWKVVLDESICAAAPDDVANNPALTDRLKALASEL